MRKLASVQAVAEIRPIEGADRIEAFRINGWWVVDQKDAHKVGDLVVYCEIDSWIPNTIAPFLSKGQEPREYNGVKGERLRTAKLRGQISQGLLLSLRNLAIYKALLGTNDWREGQDVTEQLGIQKWEPPIPAQMAGEARGLFPTFIPKTDEERVQNLPDLFAEHGEYEFAATIKVDGSSGTFYFGGPESDVHFGVCSRNWELRETAGNTLWMLARRHNLEEALSNVGGFYAIQGEAFGEGIQGNPEKIKGQELRVFNVFNINEGRKLGPQEYEDFINGLNTRFGCGLKTVPVVEKFVLGEKFKTVDEILAYAEGPSLNPDVTREGIVFKRVDGKFSFKSISNKFLLKHGDR